MRHLFSEDPPTEPHAVPYDHPGAHEIGDETRRRNGTPGPGVIVILDCGSHINAHAQRPGGEQREPPGRWSVMFGSASSRQLGNGPPLAR